MGFFKSSVLESSQSSKIRSVPACGACALYRSCDHPKFPLYGKGGKGILIVLNSPGEEEDDEGKDYQSSEKIAVEGHLASMGISVENDCWTTYALICNPGLLPEKELSNKVRNCIPNLNNVILEKKPSVIIPIGALAIKAVVAIAWKGAAEDSKKGSSPLRFVGYVIPSQRLNAWIIPNWDVSELDSRISTSTTHWKRSFKPLTSKIGTRPWVTVPDWEKKVEVLLDDDKAVEAINWFALQPDSAADYETTSLKPDKKRSSILCMSISTGAEGRTIAYPWTPKTAEATKNYWTSKGRKRASNLKFEDRWTWVKLGVRVRNWFLDTMIAAHVLDNKEGVTSIKFQAFVLLGAESYDDHIKKHLKSAKGSDQNLALENIDIRHLLIYCGLDSLLEFEAGSVQLSKLKRQHKKHCTVVENSSVL